MITILSLSRFKLHSNYISISLWWLNKIYFSFLSQTMQKEATLYYLYFHLTLSSAVSEITICWHFAILFCLTFTLKATWILFHLFA